MDRKYRFADLGFVIAVLLDFVSMFLASDGKLFWGIAAVLSVAVAAAVRLTDPADMNSMLLILDFSVAFVILGAIYSDVNGRTASWLIPAGTGCALLLLSVMFMRVREGGARGKIISFLLFALVAGLSALLLSYVADPVGGVVVGFFGALAGFGRFLLRGVFAFLEWFVSLFPESDVEIGDLPVPSPEIEMPEGGAVDNTFGTVLAVLVVLGIAAFLIASLLRLRSEKRPRFRKGERVALQKKNRAGCRGFLARLWAAFRHHMRMLVYMTKDNELARYYRLVYRKRFTKDRRRKSETPREFILRTDAGLDICEVERLLYGAEP